MGGLDAVLDHLDKLDARIRDMNAKTESAESGWEGEKEGGISDETSSSAQDRVLNILYP